MSMDRGGVARFDEARQAGLSAPQAARWVAYLRLKAARGEDPISLGEAVALVEAAHARAILGRVRLSEFADVAASSPNRIVWGSA